MSKGNVFLLSALAVGLWLAALPGVAADVELKRDGNTVAVQVQGKPFTTFYFGPEAPKPYFHPLRAPSGRIITRGYPMIKDDPEEIRTRYQDHPHHRGLWYSHGAVNGVDFWAEGKGKGHIVLKSLDEAKSGKDGRLSATFEWVTPDGKKLLTETKKVTIHGRSDARVMDIEETLQAGSEPVKLEDTKEGTFAIRLAAWLAPKNGATMVSSEGGQGEKQIWGKRANWVDYFATVEGETAGVAIFDHPANPKHPTYWHAREYGLDAANPFGEHDFYADKTRDGSLTIQPGGRIVFRYRVYIHAGDTAQAKVADEYKKYAAASKSPKTD